MSKDADFLRRARRYRREILSAYEGWQYVPMGEARSLPVPVTVGCSYNACLYCGLNQNLEFQVFPWEEIESFLQKEAFIHSRDRRPPKRAVLLHGNPFTLASRDLAQIADLIRSYFPAIEGIACFARADDVLTKSATELALLRAKGFEHITLGVESGSDQILAFHCKGLRSADNLRAMRLLSSANLRYSVYIMLGLGGEELAEEHVEQTSNLLNSSHPHEIIFVSLVLFKNAPLLQVVRKGEFTRRRPLDCMREAHSILQALHVETIFNATHKTNMFPLKGLLPRQKEQLLQRYAEEICRRTGENQVRSETRRWRSWSQEDRQCNI